MTENAAPGAPGIKPTWSSSDKDMVVTSLGVTRLWGTLGHGIINEVYWPSTGRPQIRDLGFIVAHQGGWTEVKRVEHYSFTTAKPYVPLPTIIHEGEAYRLELEVLCHPYRDALLIRYDLQGDGARLYCLLAPHLEGDASNTAIAADDLSAFHAEAALCLRADGGFSRTSAGFVGASDGWQDFTRNGAMTWQYNKAENGNIALMGETAENHGVLSLAFSESVAGARTLSRSSLADDFAGLKDQFEAGWEDWARTLDISHSDPSVIGAAQRSAMVIKVHEDRTYAGAIVASLSAPWGASRDDAGGYHLTWTRDTVQAAFAMIAVGQIQDAARTLSYLIGTQAEDGGWAQNYYPDGRGYWDGKQLDEVALPLLLAARLRQDDHINGSRDLDTMVRKAVAYIVRNGPMTDQDRWEENSGVSPFALAMAIPALVLWADSFDADGRDYILSLADYWNERIEDWTFARHGSLGQSADAEGYYVRISPSAADDGIEREVPIRNTLGKTIPAERLLGLEFLYLARMGLRPHDNRKMVATVAVIDNELRVETPNGPSFHRYNLDGYGEHEDGAPFDGEGIGRLWPLLTGERGHHAAMVGEDASTYVDAMMRMVGKGGLMPEQIWDSTDIPERGLRFGYPSGSAMPLVWAHAEFLKLVSVMAKRRPVELFPAVEARYGGQTRKAGTWHWRADSAFASMPRGRALSIEAEAAFKVQASFDDGAPTLERSSACNDIGMHCVRIDAAELDGHATLSFSTDGTAKRPYAIAIKNEDGGR